MAAAGARDIQAHTVPSSLAAAAAVAAMSVAVAIVATGVAVARGCARPHHMPRRTADVVVVLAVRVVVRAVPVVWVVVAGRAVGHGLEGHRVVKLKRIGGGHGSAAADRVHQTVKRGAPRRWEGRGGGWPRGSAVRGRKDATTSVDHPVGDLAHAEGGGMAELLLLLLTGVRVVGVTMEPGLEVVGGLLGELAALAGGRAVDKGGLGRHVVMMRGAGR
jgi:hypothetical protein